MKLKIKGSFDITLWGAQTLHDESKPFGDEILALLDTGNRNTLWHRKTIKPPQSDRMKGSVPS